MAKKLPEEAWEEGDLTEEEDQPDEVQVADVDPSREAYYQLATFGPFVAPRSGTVWSCEATSTRSPTRLKIKPCY